VLTSTPCGADLWRFLWDTVGIGAADIEDWQPLFRWPSHLVGWVLTAGVAFAAWRRGGRASITALLPPIALGVLALRVIRLEGFFALATIALVAPYLASFGPKHLPPSRVPTHREVVAVGFVSLAGVAIAATAIVRVSPGRLRFSDLDANTRWAPEAESVLFLLAQTADESTVLSRALSRGGRAGKVHAVTRQSSHERLKTGWIPAATRVGPG